MHRSTRRVRQTRRSRPIPSAGVDREVAELVRGEKRAHVLTSARLRPRPRRGVLGPGAATSLTRPGYAASNASPPSSKRSAGSAVVSFRRMSAAPEARAGPMNALVNRLRVPLEAASVGAGRRRRVPAGSAGPARTARCGAGVGRGDERASDREQSIVRGIKRPRRRCRSGAGQIQRPSLPTTSPRKRREERYPIFVFTTPY
jgi:hypothetical protein